MNLKLSVVGLLALAVSGVTALAETSHPASEIDLTAAANAAGMSVTTKGNGTCPSGYNVNNAFGSSLEQSARVFFVESANTGFKDRVKYQIKDEFEPGKTILVTSYTVRRTATDGTDPSEKFSKNRAPTKFSLHGSQDGMNWVDLDRQENIDWWADDTPERTFAIDPHYAIAYRYYMFEVNASTAESDDKYKCAFQFVKLNGVVDSMRPVLAACQRIGYLRSGADQTSGLILKRPVAKDAKVELDLSFIDVTGTRGIFAANPSGADDHFRLFHTAEDGWRLFYGDLDIKSGVKAYAGVRYRVCVDGPVVTVNDVKVIDAGEKQAGTVGTHFSIGGSLTSTLDMLENVSLLNIWSVKVTDAEGNVQTDLKPYLFRDGTGRFFDEATEQFELNQSASQRPREVARLGVHFRPLPSEMDITEQVRNAGKATVTLKEGEPADPTQYGCTNLFTRNETVDGRALFKGFHNVVQYDIADDFNAGKPVVLTRYALLPTIGKKGDDMSSRNRGPTEFELQASKDGESWVTLHKRTRGVGMQSYANGNYAANGYGYGGFFMNIPEEVRGDYRHYRFITENSSAPDTDVSKVGLQEIRFFGYLHTDPTKPNTYQPCEPLEYVKNYSDQQNKDNTYYRTELVGTCANNVGELSVEIRGEFTQVASSGVTMGLFCARNNDLPGRQWICWYNLGKLRLDCGSSSVESDFAPEADREYVIKAVGNKLYVDNVLVQTAAGEPTFQFANQILLMSSHNALMDINNQARFKLKSCKICRIVETGDVVLGDYVPVKGATGTAGLLNLVDGKFIASSGKPAVAGPAKDCDFRQRGKRVEMTSELEGGRLPKEVEFAFSENQALGAKLYAAYDTSFKGSALTDWAKVVELGSVKTETTSLSVEVPRYPAYKYVKFFLGDSLGNDVSWTQSYKSGRRGLIIIFQ